MRSILKANPSPSKEDPNDQKIFAELVKLLYLQAKGAIAGSFVTVLCLIIGLFNSIPKSLLFSWLCIWLIVAALRLRIINLFASQTFDVNKAGSWHNLFLIVTILSALCWAFMSLTFEPLTTISETLIILAMTGVAACSVPYFAASRIVASTYLLIVLVSLGCRLLSQPGSTRHLIAVLVGIYLVVLIVAAFQIYNVIYNAIKYKFVNDDLIQRLSESNKQNELINQELKIENQERKDIETLLRNSEDQYRLVTNALPVLIAYMDNDWVFRFNNQAYESWFNRSSDEIVGKSAIEIIGATAFSTFIDNYEQLLLGKQVTYETAMYFHETQERFVSVTLIPHIRDNELQGVFSLISDVTPRINFLATHDALTNLPNRSLFTARFTHALTQAIKNSSKLALLFLDLDHFKNVNDTLGHDIGDQLLIRVVERLQECIEHTDTIARLGGDEFILLLHVGDDTNRAAAVAQKICDVLAKMFVIGDKEIYITTSIGISIYPTDGTVMGVLLKNADMAMYRAKGHGRNTYEFYTHGMNELMQKKLLIATQLRCAIERNELKVYYQPIIDVETKSILGVESLLRWHHPDMGIISPHEFIPIAEETDMIETIGEWVLETVCKQKSRLCKLGLGNINFAVNISARQFTKQDLSKRVAAILEATNVAGKEITLELTETMIMNDINHSMQVIKALKELNVSISIDDFGTGYSSLNYLKNFPVDVIKIDRSFVTDFAINHEDTAIVKAIITLAHNLNMSVIAEGVETPDQFKFLKEHNCDAVQGRLIYPSLLDIELEHILQHTYPASTP